MFKKLMVVLAMLLGSMACASNESGTLYRLASAGLHDFNYLSSMQLNHSALGSPTPIKLKSRFSWFGRPGEKINTDQHAILAMTQSFNHRPLYNALGYMAFSHGAGALIGERGLALELWFEENGAPNAHVWSQDNGRCVLDVVRRVILRQVRTT